MPIRAEDLPLAMRKKLGIHTPSKKSRAGVGDSLPCELRCLGRVDPDGSQVTCGLEFPSYSKAKAHVEAEGHRRVEAIL